MQKIINFLTKRIEDCRDESEVYIKNEIDSNVVMGRIVFVMMLSGFLCIFLCLIGVFEMNYKILMTVLIIVTAIQAPILIINKVTKGHLKIARYMLVWSCVLIVALFIILYGTQTMLITIYPMLLSIRYCDEGFAKDTAILSLFTCLFACIAYNIIGGIDLNVYYLAEPTITFTAGEPVVLIGIDKATYLFRLFMYNYLSEGIALIIIAITVVNITKRGRRMIIDESKIAEKSARLDTELNLAIGIQSNMLKKRFPAFRSHPNIDLYAYNTPAKEMGGDFYDFFRIDDDHVAIVMADVSGKGIGAAFFMSISKSSLRYCVRYNATPAKILENTNQYLCDNNESTLFVTCWLGIYEVSTHKLTYANAGHNHPIVIKKGGSAHYLKSKTGFVLAGLEKAKYTDYTIDLDVGDEIVLYTDGVTEANNKDMELFGDDRLLTEIDKVKDLTSKEQVEHVVSVVNKFMNDTEQFDDITMLTMKIN